jgi:hypothetical protein
VGSPQGIELMDLNLGGTVAQISLPWLKNPISSGKLINRVPLSRSPESLVTGISELLGAAHYFPSRVHLKAYFYMQIRLCLF